MTWVWARVRVRANGAIGMVWEKYFRVEWPTPMPPREAMLLEVAAQGFEYHGMTAVECGYE